MSDRSFPYDPLANCDQCGALGAFDIFGDFYCEQHLADEVALEEDVPLGEVLLDEEDDDWAALGVA